MILDFIAGPLATTMMSDASSDSEEMESSTNMVSVGLSTAGMLLSHCAVLLL